MLLIQGVYLYEYMDEWENFNETTLPNIAFNSNLNMEDIKDSDYNYAKSFRKDFETKSSGTIMICILKETHCCWLMFWKTLEKCV